MSTAPQTDSIAQLFQDMHACRLCRGVLPPAVPRSPAVHDPRSKLMVVSEAPSDSQVHVSGVPWFFPDGSPGPSNAYFESFLNQLGYSLRPAQDIPMPRGGVLRAAAAPLVAAYMTDMAKCCPGRDARGSLRHPSDAQLRTCVRAFFARELALVRPKVVLCAGKAAWETLASLLPPGRVPDGCRRISDMVQHILAHGAASVPTLELAATGQLVHVCPIFHPSGANRGNHHYNAQLVPIIRALLQ